MTERKREYAIALFELAEETNERDGILRSLLELDAIIKENPDYVSLLGSPALSLDERMSLIDEAMSGAIQEDVVSFIKLLCEKGHISELSEIIREYDGLEKLANRTVEARIYYVNEPSEAQKTALIQKLEAVSGKKICATYIEDSALIGGIRVEYDDKVIDGSLANRMKKIKGVISE